MGKFLDSLRRSVSVSKRQRPDQQDSAIQHMQKDANSPLKPTKLTMPGSAEKAVRGTWSPPADKLRAVRSLNARGEPHVRWMAIAAAL